MFRHTIGRWLMTALLAALPLSGLAADEPDVKPGSDKLAQARSHIQARQWAAALDELKRVNDTGSADWNNLMGYSLRKSSKPDLDAAERFYNEALRIDPKHRNAIEYLGELHLMKGDLAAAEKRLAALDKLCTFGCEQYTDLKKAIERYKSAGNKFVSAP
jgi:tetratricopeptide (TPR) repeat protein